VATITCLLVIGAGAVLGLYQGRFQTGSGEEVRAIVSAVGVCAALLELIALRSAPVLAGRPEMVGGAALFSGLCMISARTVIRAAHQRSRPSATSAIDVIVFGAGSAGTQLVHRLVGEHGARYRPVAMLDDDPAKRNLRIRGIPVRGGREELARVAAKTGARLLVIAIASRSGRHVGDLTRLAEQCGLTAQVIPSVQELLTGAAQVDRLRDPRIADLLGRDPICIDPFAVASCFLGKRILVTGAGGSIGSELCGQLHRLQPAALIMLDRDESALHAVELALNGRALLDSDEVVLADIRDSARIHEVLAVTRPDIVFHAAALKHLPLLERYPAEAVKTNIFGTLNMLEASAAAGVGVFVNISTDKAADPVSVLGMSKRVTERLTSHAAAEAPGAFLSVRFGNVLGSRGSLLTSLSAQIVRGGPLTVTHPEVSRYFMTASEAVQLVLQAVVVGGSGEVMVLDLGEPVLIADLARRLAAQTARSIDIVYTGLRPGEKLAEDLLGPGEPDHRPHHPLVSQALVPPLRPQAVRDLDITAQPQAIRAALAKAVLAELPLPASSKVSL
jgi:FlaA1/EpsC-like NDP-sugar epimerase